MEDKEEKPVFVVRRRTRRWLYRFGYDKDDIQQEIAFVETKHGGFSPIYTRFHFNTLLTRNFCPTRKNKKGRNVSFESCSEELVNKLATNQYEVEDEVIRNELMDFVKRIVDFIKFDYKNGEYYVDILMGKITVADYAREVRKTRQNCCIEFNKVKRALKRIFEKQYNAYL